MVGHSDAAKPCHQVAGMREGISQSGIPYRPSRRRSVVGNLTGLSMLWLVAACSADANLSDLDQSAMAITGDKGACWQQVCPGIAEMPDVVAAIEGQSFVAPDSHSVQDISWPGYPNASRLVWDCIEPKRRWCGQATFSDGTLQHLWLALDRGIAIHELVALHGAPDHLAYSDDPWTTACRVDLIWLDARIVGVTRALKDCSDLLSQSASTGLSSAFRIRELNLYSDRALAQSLNDRDPVLKPWPGISNSAPSRIQLVPGSYSMWATMIGAVGLVALVGIVKPRVHSALIAFPVAGIAALGPTLAFQFSDICVPTIAAWLMNSLLLGLLYMGIIGGLRRMRSCALPKPTSIDDETNRP